ncbi:MAG: murein biosynthesis integral membrane protein MurJ [Clostridia bacterium]|nr:murein biosynthesis integral membrane protein MurJ [Clostridia bacterium]
MTEAQKKRLAGAAIIVMISTILSRITGYLREMLIPTKLGVGMVGDAYNVAFLVPDLMYNLILGGAIAAALIPVLSGYIERNEEKDGWKAVGTFINITFFVMLFFCILGMVFTDKLIPIVADGFRTKGPETQLLAIRLTRILFPSVSFLMLAGMCNGVLNSYHRFTAAAFGPVIYNLGGVLSLLLFGSSTALGAECVAYGVMTSALIYFLFQLSVAFKNLKLYRFNIDLKHPGFIKLFKLAIPSLISSSVVQINLIISSRFATYAAVGSVTLFNSANRTWQLPLGIFAQSMGVALLPTLSARLAVGDTKEYHRILMKGLKTVLLLAIPSAFAIVVLREPVIRTLFKFSTKFTEESVATAGYILMFFSLALVSQSIVAMMTRAYFAANDTKTPLFIGSSTIIINGVLSYWLFYYTPMSVAGMAIAYSISSTVYAALLILLLNRRVKGVDVKELIMFMLKVSTAALIMGLVLYPVNLVLPVDINSKLSQAFFLGIEAVIGSIIYFALVVLLRIEEGIYLINSLKSRFGRIIKV